MRLAGAQDESRSRSTFSEKCNGFGAGGLCRETGTSTVEMYIWDSYLLFVSFVTVRK